MSRSNGLPSQLRSMKYCWSLRAELLESRSADGPRRGSCAARSVFAGCQVVCRDGCRLAAAPAPRRPSSIVSRSAIVSLLFDAAAGPFTLTTTPRPYSRATRARQPGFMTAGSHADCRHVLAGGRCARPSAGASRTAAPGPRRGTDWRSSCGRRSRPGWSEAAAVRGTPSSSFSSADASGSGSPVRRRAVLVGVVLARARYRRVESGAPRSAPRSAFRAARTARRAVAAVAAAEEEHHLRRGRDHAGDRRRDGTDQDVAVVDVHELVTRARHGVRARSAEPKCPRCSTRPRWRGCARSRRRWGPRWATHTGAAWAGWPRCDSSRTMRYMRGLLHLGHGPRVHGADRELVGVPVCR